MVLREITIYSVVLRILAAVLIAGILNEGGIG